MKGCYWFFVDNIKIKKGESPEILLLAALPMTHKGQKVEIKKIYPDPIEIVEDRLSGNRIVIWQQSNLKERKGFYFYYDFEVSVSEVKSNIDPKKIERYDQKTRGYKRYTKSEPWIEITDGIKKKAKKIISSETNPYYQAKKIFDWVVKNMTYQYPDIKERGATQSFKKRKGDCGEFSVVFCALCRSIGIPARTVTCVWFVGSGHQWAEILLPPYGWVPVDTTTAQLLMPHCNILSEEEIKKFMETCKIPVKDPDYLFGNLYPNRLIVSIGNNIKVNSKKLEIKRKFRFLQPGGYTCYPPSIEFKGIIADVVGGGFYLFGDNCNDLKNARDKAQRVLAGQYLEKGLLKKAEKGLKKKLEDNKKNAVTWLQMGQVYMKTKRYDKAIESFTNAISGKAGSIKHVIEALAHNLLGNCYDIKGERKLAIEQYNKVLNRNINFQGAVDHAKKYLKKPFKIIERKKR